MPKDAKSVEKRIDRFFSGPERGRTTGATSWTSGILLTVFGYFAMLLAQ
jgi:hypothetical protein